MGKRIRPPRPGHERRRKLNAEALYPGDVVEYKLTIHVEPEPGIDAWVGYGVTSQVQEGESGDEADSRIRRHVEEEIERRADEALDRLL